MDALVTHLRALVRHLHREAVRVAGATAARRGHRRAFERLWADEELWSEILRIVESPTELRGRLAVTAGLPERTIDLVEREYTFGRTSACDVVLKNASVSRQHARVTPRQGRFVLRDLGSTSGTLVAGRALTEPRVLETGDVIALGEVALRFEQVS